MWQRNGMKPNEPMLILFKFGQEEHLTSFREQGQMHMRTMRYLQKKKAKTQLAAIDLKEHPSYFSQLL
jgi:hypothetical protein